MTNGRLAWLAPAYPALVVAALGAACGLVSSDITKVTVALPDKFYRFDTQESGWKGADTMKFGTVPAISCTSDADCCPPAVVALGLDCSSIVCDLPPGTGTCAFALTIETPPQTIDLKMEEPRVSAISSQNIIDIAISQITYKVKENSLNVDLPPVELFLADNGATSTQDPSAVHFGTVPVIPKMMAPIDGNVTLLQPAAKDAFNKIGHNLGTPFVFIARSRVLVAGGTPVPSGALSIIVGGSLSAQPGL